MPTSIDDILDETPSLAKPGASASPYDDILAETPGVPKAPKLAPAPPYLHDRPGPAQDYAGTIPGLRASDAPPAPPRPPLPQGLSQPQTTLGQVRTLISPASEVAGQSTPTPAGDSAHATMSARNPGLMETLTAPVREGAIGRAFGTSTETAAARDEDPSNPVLRFEAMTP